MPLFLKSFQYLVLLLRRGRGKSHHAWKHLCGQIIHTRQSLLVKSKGVAGKCLQGMVNEIDNAGFGCARQLIGWDDARGNGFHLARLFRRKNLEFNGLFRLHRLMSVLCRGNQRRPLGLHPRRSRDSAYLEKKFAACCVCTFQHFILVLGNLRFSLAAVKPLFQWHVTPNWMVSHLAKLSACSIMASGHPSWIHSQAQLEKGQSGCLTASSARSPLRVSTRICSLSLAWS